MLSQCRCTGASTSQIKGFLCGGNAGVNIPPVCFNSITQWSRMPSCRCIQGIHSQMLVLSSFKFFPVHCIACNQHAQNHERKLHLEMPLQTNSVSTFITDYNFPSVLQDYRCPTWVHFIAMRSVKSFCNFWNIINENKAIIIEGAEGWPIQTKPWWLQFPAQC